MPSSLHGRAEEVSSLFQAFQRSIQESDDREQQELVLIRGASGSGKTALANSLRSSVERYGGLFLSGKFQITASLQDPYAVFVSAFAQLVETLIERRNNNDDNDDDSSVNKVCQLIQTITETDGDLLANIFPSLERLIGVKLQAKAVDVKGTQALQRFQFLLGKLVYGTSVETPLVLFLDDLQWGDKASLDLLQSLLRSRQGFPKSRLLVIGAYREEGIDDTSQHSMKTLQGSKLPFSKYLDNFRQLEATKEILLTKIHLLNLDEKCTTLMVADFLDSESSGFVVSLGQALQLRCHGNPYHTLQSLNTLTTRGILCRDEDTHQWQWNDEDILFNLDKPETIDELVHRKLETLPELSLKVLQVAACIGDDVDVCSIAMILDAKIADIDLAIQAAIAEQHLTCERQHCRLRFSHDRVRQAVLTSIDDKDALSFSIGFRLWTSSSCLALNEQLFVIANLLNCGKARIVDRSQRYQAASLNLDAGMKAASLAAFPDAARYLNSGIEFLKGGDHWNEQYDLSIKLFSTAADIEVCTFNFDRVMELVDEVLVHAHTVQDTLTAQVAKINAYGQHGSIKKAIETGIDVLSQLKEPLPPRATKMAIVFEVIKAKSSLGGRSDDDILKLPSMEDREKLAAMHILSVLLPYTYQAADTYNPLMGTRLLRLCLKHGLHKNCAFGFCTLGWVLCGSDRKEGYRLGILALNIIERTRAKELLPRVHMKFYGLIHHWQRPLRESLEPLQRAANVGIEIGDVEYAMIAIYFKCTHSISCGMNLKEVEKLLVETVEKMKRYKQMNMLQLIKPALQYVHNLTGRALDPTILRGQVVGPEDVPTDVDILTVQLTHFYFGANLAYRFGDYNRADQQAEKRRNMSYQPFALYSYTAIIQMEGLIAIAQARVGNRPRRGYKQGRQAWKKIKMWAKDCPQNFLCRQLMLEAELKSLKTTGRRISCVAQIRNLYEKSAELATQEGFLHEAATAYELAGDYVMRRGDHVAAEKYWTQAREFYVSWGATAKVHQLDYCREQRKIPTITL